MCEILSLPWLPCKKKIVSSLSLCDGHRLQHNLQTLSALSDPRFYVALMWRSGCYTVQLGYCKWSKFTSELIRWASFPRYVTDYWLRSSFSLYFMASGSERASGNLLHYCLVFWCSCHLTLGLCLWSLTLSLIGRSPSRPVGASGFVGTHVVLMASVGACVFYVCPFLFLALVPHLGWGETGPLFGVPPVLPAMSICGDPTLYVALNFSRHRIRHSMLSSCCSSWCPWARQCLVVWCMASLWCPLLYVFVA